MSLSSLFRRRRRKTRPSTRRGEPKFTGGGDDGNDISPRNSGRRKKKPGFRIPWWKLGFTGLALCFIFAAYIGYNLPGISTLGDFKKTPSITVRSEDGTVVGTYGDVYGDYVPYAQMPKSLINAVVATEDRNFFHHFGVDPVGLLRAMVVNLRARHLVQGGSTITQQLAKNAFLTPDRTLKRKLQEMVLAVELERRYTKEAILTIYLNRVYMGAGNYGVDAAAHRYFGHSVRELTLPESAILVGLLKAPSRYAPTSNPDLSEKRASQVLLNMVDAHYLTPAQAEAAKASLMGDDEATYRDSHGFGSFYFTDWVVGQLPELIGEVQGDIVVTTTLKPDLQRLADDAVDEALAKKGAASKASQAALLAISPDGAIRAMVGGRSYRASQFNRVTQALRQPGSSFKLFVYLAGLEAGFTPMSEMVDQPVTVGKWHPRDYTGKYQGRMTLRDAFAQSINSIAIQLSETVGRSRVIDMARRLGITTPMEADPSIALGTNEVTLLEMTRAYAQLANNGGSVAPYAIERIDKAGGGTLFERNHLGNTTVLATPTVNMMNSMLLAVTTVGTGRAAQIGRPVAGKTGTTSDYRDAWFIGFTPQLTTGVWVGNDDTSPMKKVTGGGLPASIWHGFMSEAMKGEPVMEIPNEGGPGMLDHLLPSWLGGAPAAPQPGMPPATYQPAPARLSPPLQQAPAAPEAIPEDEPTPEYNAPPSFWDKLLGDSPRDDNQPPPGRW